MSWTKIALEYMREGYTEAEAYEIVALERKAAEREARRPEVVCPSPEYVTEYREAEGMDMDGAA